MRPGLQDAQRAAGGIEDGYPRGSVVICQGCLKPLYVLIRGIGVGERAGRSVSAYRPVNEGDLQRLVDSVEPGVSALVKTWTAEERRQHCQSIPELRSGSPALCPCCQHSFVRVRAVDAAEVLDRGYTFELVTIHPGQMVSGKEARAWVR